MPAYLLARVQVHDPETYQKYTALTPNIIRAHGGRFLTRGASETLEGPEVKDRVVLVEFPSKEAVQSFYHSPEYQAAMKFRQAASDASFLLLDGVKDGFSPEANVIKTV